MKTFSQDKDINAPADIARRLMNATVMISVPKIASLICVAASTLPPNVLISNIIALAFLDFASSSILFIKGGKPRSIVPCIGILYTVSEYSNENI